MKMADSRYRVVKVKGVQPETFWIVWEDSALPKGSMFNTSSNLTETEVRAELAKCGLIAADIDSLIESARRDPK
jgi:hypothetical protein